MAGNPSGVRERRTARTLRLIGRYVRVNLAANAAYPGPFAIQVIAMAANNALFLAFWVILFEAIDAPIRGYSFTDVAFCGRWRRPDSGSAPSSAATPASSRASSTRATWTCT